MSINLSKGQKINLSKESAGLSQIMVGLLLMSVDMQFKILLDINL